MLELDWHLMGKNLQTSSLAIFLAAGGLLLEAPVVARAASTDVQGIVRAGDTPQANVVIWIDAPKPARRADPPPTLDQRNLDFSPRVLAVQVGTVVTFPNNDRVFHNVFSFHNGKRFDLGLYPTGSMKRIAFDKPGVSHLFCNIHPHMAAYIVAVESPYFAVSNEEGRFTIRDLPPGQHTYHTWRPGRPTTTASATISPETLWEVR